MTKRWEKKRDEVQISPLMQRLRDELDAAGFDWHDDSEEFGFDDYVYHMERTKVTCDWHGTNDIQIASCIYGYTVNKGHEMAMTYGWPDLIEGWPDNINNPEPMTVDEIIEAVRAL